MPKVTINRPNRTRRRFFKACDAARIAREVVRDDPETTPEEVLACIAKGFGFTHVSLSRPRAVESGVSLKKSALITLAKSILVLVKKIQLVFPNISKYLIPLIRGIEELINIIDAIDFFDPESAKVDDVINKEKCVCKDAPKQKEVQNASQ